MLTQKTSPILETGPQTALERGYSGTFGKTVSGHMLLIPYRGGDWQPPEVLPFGRLPLTPASLCLHYGQTIFEGMKAFRRKDGRITLFRVEKHHQRFCASARRMCMPEIPLALFKESLISLITQDEAWLPDAEEGALYIRPFLIATEEAFGVKIAEEYLFIAFSGPVGSYYTQSLTVKVEDHYIRAGRGGFGSAKCGGNYGGALYPTELARSKGFDQLLWTDGSSELYLEESGTMNLFFRIKDVLITPPLSDTILDGITRDSYIVLAKENGWPVEERKISAYELLAASRQRTLQEAFGAGTAAVAIPMASITLHQHTMFLPPLPGESFCRQLREQLTAIRTGEREDRYGWNTII